MAVVHEITTDAEGNRHGTDDEITVTLLGRDGRMFKRRATSTGGGESCWLVAELNGVRVYQEGAHVIVTDRDLYQ